MSKPFPKDRCYLLLQGARSIGMNLNGLIRNYLLVQTSSEFLYSSLLTRSLNMFAAGDKKRQYALFHESFQDLWKILSYRNTVKKVSGFYMITVPVMKELEQLFWSERNTTTLPLKSFLKYSVRNFCLLKCKTLTCEKPKMFRRYSEINRRLAQNR